MIWQWITQDGATGFGLADCDCGQVLWHNACAVYRNEEGAKYISLRDSAIASYGRVELCDGRVSFNDRIIGNISVSEDGIRFVWVRANPTGTETEQEWTWWQGGGIVGWSRSQHDAVCLLVGGMDEWYGVHAQKIVAATH